MVEFSISKEGELFNLDYISRELGIMPTSTWCIGEFGTYAVHRDTAWNLGTGYKKSHDFNEQLMTIFEQLQSKADKLVELKKQFDLFYMFDIVVNIMDGISPVFYVNAPIISFASKIGAIFSVDLYASFNETKKRKRKAKVIMRRFTPMNGVIVRARKSAQIHCSDVSKANAVSLSEHTDNPNTDIGNIEDYLIDETYFNYPIVKADFKIIGQDFDINHITQALSVNPNYSWSIGERNFAGMIRKETCWALSSRYRKSYDVDEQLQPILNLLRRKIAQLLILKTMFNVSYQIRIAIKIIDGRTPALGFDIDDIDFAHKIGAEFVVDFYSR
jgi:hypothetical protein